MSEPPFDGIDLDLPDEQFAEWLDFVLCERTGVDKDGSELPAPSSDEIGLLQKWSREAGPKTRKIAVQILVDYGPCSWEDLETWALDADESVRHSVMWTPAFGPALGLLESDKTRWVRVLAEAAKRYPDDYSAASALRDLVDKDHETLDLTWSAAEGLLDIDDPELCTMLEVCYFEHVIPDLGLGPEDRHVRPWLAGSDCTRKRVLLRIAAYWGLDNGRMREIVGALAHVKDKQIASIAEGVLAGRVKYGDIN